MILLQALTRALKNSPRLEFGSFTDTRIFKFSLGVILLMLFSFQTYAQNDSWILLKEESGVKIYYQITQCDSQETVDPLELLEGNSREDILKLKFVNGGSSVQSVTYAKVTKNAEVDELETIELGVGTTIVATCETLPKIILTQQADDNYPITVNDFLEVFTITINQ
jgi:hypothetical protein